MQRCNRRLRNSGFLQIIWIGMCEACLPVRKLTRTLLLRTRLQATWYQKPNNTHITFWLIIIHWLSRDSPYQFYFYFFLCTSTWLISTNQKARPVDSLVQLDAMKCGLLGALSGITSVQYPTNKNGQTGLANPTHFHNTMQELCCMVFFALLAPGPCITYVLAPNSSRNKTVIQNIIFQCTYSISESILLHTNYVPFRYESGTLSEKKLWSF